MVLTLTGPVVNVCFEKKDLLIVPLYTVVVLQVLYE